MDRAHRRERWESLFSPGRLALTGACASMILLFQPSLAGRVIILAAAASAAWLSGRKLSPVTTALVMTGIVTANLLVPLGRKLLVWGPLIITETALMSGIEKAVTFEALVFISKACLGPGLRLPGTFGAFFAKALRTYDRILAYKGKIRVPTFMEDIDAALLAVYPETAHNEHGTGGPDASRAGSGVEAAKFAVRRGDRYLPIVLLVAAGTFLIA